MNIKDAKEQIKNAITAYFTKDCFGCYKIPIEKQRPVFLIGPPGIGKTAIMEQVAAELGVGLISYSMTHHTRQSALGLPFIVQERFDGQDYQMSEYTMSEIIGSVHRLMRETGVREGILFLDEINCVSETLAPCMLQFLQYKVFGQHRVPDGWIVVTAGNPPEYNKSVRDFDIVTWDRLKRIDVEPDYDAWREYARQKGVHPAITTYLDARRKDFYTVESTVDGKSFVTARGWEDLSEMLLLYESNALPVDEKLIGQYLQHRRIAKDFAVYYDLYCKYRSDYQVDAILAGTAPDSILQRAGHAKFDERLSLLGLLLGALGEEVRQVNEQEDCLRDLMAEVKLLREGRDGDAPLSQLLQARIDAQYAALEQGHKASSLAPARQRRLRRIAAALEQYRRHTDGDNCAVFAAVKADFDRSVADLDTAAQTVRTRMDHLFAFCESAFGSGQELLLLVTELTANRHTARFIGRYGCDRYFAHNESLKFHERQKDLDRRIGQLNL